ncbi:MAG TPA: biotin--[acetyl-CoA-carboxylase] ligase [Polyangiaceae bacterium]|nr:biotin--[acetyl-CoA-carboxylase] ligase [Polyangiaceae bacterium]
MTDLDRAAIELELDRLGAALGRPLSVVALTGSTNDDAKQAAERGAPHGATFIADAQSAGRGRGGHTWHSPPGENLYMSVVLRPRLEVERVAPITLAVGALVARVVEGIVGQGAGPIGVKWPNDIFAGGRKLGGILVEGRLRGAEVSHVVVGLGLNVRASAFPPAIADRATSLQRLGCERLDRAVIAAALLAAIGAGLPVFEAEGLRPFLTELSARDVLCGARVDVSGERGVAEGIDENGRLLLRREDGSLCRVASGEVTVS